MAREQEKNLGVWVEVAPYWNVNYLTNRDNTVWHV